jgi:ABC-type uncharacterized transport system permease subunit
MLLAIYAAFSLGVAIELAAAVLALVLPFRSRSIDSLRLPQAASAAGALLLAVALGLRWVLYGRVPLTSGVESLSLLVIMLTVTVLGLTYHERRRALLLVYLPAIAGIALVAAILAPTELVREPKELSPWLLLLHVVPAFLAYAWFLIAMLTSGVYLYQASRLKRRSFPGLIQQLPPLEHLDGTLFALVRLAYPMFVWTLILGYYWAWYDRAQLGEFWWMSPKIVLSLCMVVIYAASYHGRALGWLRGARLARFLLVGVGGMLFAYLFLEILGLTNYNFWGGGA